MHLRRRIAAGSLATLVIIGGISGSSLQARASGRTATSPVARDGRITTKAYAFNASYSGHISILWNSSGLTTASISGVGKGTNFGLTTVTGAGSVMASAQSDPINGRGVLRGKGETLTLKFNTGSVATATSSTPPTTVVVAGTAKVLGGSGRFAKAAGSLKVSGAFSIQGTSGKESDTFNATLKGTVKVRS